MATGSLTYKGLAVPLWGESEITQITAATDILTITGASGISGDFFICRLTDGTEVVQIQDNGRTRILLSSDGQNALDVKYTLTASNANQCYGATIWFESGGFASAGGRHAVLNLFYAYDGGGGNAHSFINFAAPGASSEPPTLFTILDVTAGNGLFIASNETATHGLRIFVAGVEYFIKLSPAT
jgi:hypothetical protein